MSFFCRLTRRHYWCTPHRSADNRLVQVCYECGAERPARELHNEGMPEYFASSPGPNDGAITRPSMKPVPIRRPSINPPPEKITADAVKSVAVSK
jgi:hypothetical protein